MSSRLWQIHIGRLVRKQIVIDGKKQRGTSPTFRGNKGLYILNAWVSENCFCLAQEKVEDKSNEIAAIPEILSDIDITGSVVSIDAAGTQRHIAEQIIPGGSHYLLAVKENQRSLYKDIECAFKVNHGTDAFEEVDAGHGRIETRKCSILSAKDYLMDETLALWKNLSTIIRIDTIRQVKDKSSHEPRYYISDETEPNATYYASLARGHWGIENQLHWHLGPSRKTHVELERASLHKIFPY